MGETDESWEKAKNWTQTAFSKEGKGGGGLDRESATSEAL